jgi:peroxiredoxin
MTIKVGDKNPAVTFTVMTEGGPKPVTTEEFFGGKKVVLFSVPGAFTPTCSAKHLPGYVDHIEQLFSKGVDAVGCVSVNDVFVMNAWGKSANASDIAMLADGNGVFAKAVGLELDASAYGMGQRSQRFALVADDGIVTQLFVEAPGEFKVSSAEHVLSAL